MQTPSFVPINLHRCHVSENTLYYLSIKDRSRKQAVFKGIIKVACFYVRRLHTGLKQKNWLTTPLSPVVLFMSVRDKYIK